MANLDRIVNVTIALRTAGAQQRSFSDLMLVGEVTNANRVTVITDPDDLLIGYGLTETSPMYKAAQTAFSQIPTVSRLYIGKRVNGESVPVTMAALQAANDGWYGFAEPARTAADALAYAAWAESHSKLFLMGLLQGQTTGTTNLGQGFKDGNYFRTAWWLTPSANDFPEIATACRAFTVLPGGETWANLRLQAVSSPGISETLYQAVTALNGNTFEPFRNVSITQNGKTAGGEWIDVIRFRDWLCEEIRVREFNHFVDRRIPFTDAGIASIHQRLKEALDLGVARGGIAPPEPNEDNNALVPSYTTSVPLSTSISPGAKASRVLEDLTFTARLAGAIHATKITGVLTYENIG